MSGCAVLDDFPRIDVADIRKLVGGRKRLKAADSVVLHLAAVDLSVSLTKCESNLGAGRWYTLLICPSCSRRVAVLRLLPGGTGAACGTCLRRVTRARYSSQICS